MTKAISSLILLAATSFAAPALAADPPNIAEIVQSGLNATAVLTQQGSGDLMSIVQMGDGNIAHQTQLGDHNSMSAVQLGSGNALEHVQLGSGLSPVDIVQLGGAAVTVI